jgi:hypothetical protein
MTPNPADGHRDPSEIAGRTTFRRDNASYRGVSCGNLPQFEPAR